MPSYNTPVVAILPEALTTAGVLCPIALPVALFTNTLVDKALAGRLALAVESLAVLASAVSALM